MLLVCANSIKLTYFYFSLFFSFSLLYSRTEKLIDDKSQITGQMEQNKKKITHAIGVEQITHTHAIAFKHDCH